MYTLSRLSKTTLLLWYSMTTQCVLVQCFFVSQQQQQLIQNTIPIIHDFSKQQYQVRHTTSSSRSRSPSQSTSSSPFDVTKRYISTSLHASKSIRTVLDETNNNDTTNTPTIGGGVRTIQILMSDTGGGHRASANALRDAFQVLYPNRIECDIVDIYTNYGAIWPYNDYVRIYKIMAKYSWMWELFYYGSATPFGLMASEFLLHLFNYQSFKECLYRLQPSTGQRADMIVSVHPLTQDLPLKILRELDSQDNQKRMLKSSSTTTVTSTTTTTKLKKTPFVTVVTDLGSAHPTWFHPDVDQCFVPSTALYQSAQERGLSSKQITQYGLPIRKGFWNEYGTSSTPATSSTRSGIMNQNQKERLRMELGIQSDLPTVLVVGGGDGMGGLVAISQQLGEQLGSDKSNIPTTTTTNQLVDNNTGKKKYQLIIVCGNNQEAKNTLENYSWPSTVKVQIQGFVTNMDEWMKASDILVTKAGPGTIAEASICGLPCMMFAFLPGQEEGNIPFVEKAGFGCYENDPIKIGQTVRSWLESPGTLQTLQNNALNAARPHATLDIAKDIGEILLGNSKPENDSQQRSQQQQLGKMGTVTIA